MSSELPNISGQLDPLTLQIYRLIDDAASQLRIPWIIIGATARDLIYEKLSGVRPRRLTKDVDLAIQIRSWKEHQRLCSLLVESKRFSRSDTKHRLLFGHAKQAIPVDIVPFGEIEDRGTIAWPPDMAVIMSTAGFSDALSSSLRLQVDEDPEFYVSVVHPAVLVALKIFAWHESPERGRDAGDVNFLIKAYDSVAGNERRMYDENVDLFEDEQPDLDLAIARLLGRDLRRLLSNEVTSALSEIVAREIDLEDGSRLLGDMMSQSKENEELCRKQLVGLARGMADRPR